eukprot:tig00020965_g16858.t1
MASPVHMARSSGDPATAPQATPIAPQATPIAMPPSGTRVTREELVANFEHPIQDVARRLGVCVTVLKKICRSHGITRWPQRKLRSVVRWIEQADVVVQNRVPGFDHAAIAHVAQRLREIRSRLYSEPDTSIRDVTGTIRKLLVQPIQQRLNAICAADAAGGRELDGEESEGEDGIQSGKGKPKTGGVQMDDITTYLQSYLAAAKGPEGDGAASSSSRSLPMAASTSSQSRSGLEQEPEQNVRPAASVDFSTELGV